MTTRKPPGSSRSAATCSSSTRSRPTEGPSAATGRAVAAGERQALADAGARAGRYRIRLVELSASKPGSGNWDPGQVSENASRAAKDPRAIAYVGELNLGASAVSVPVTNKAGLLQVSPTDGLASLTEQPPALARPARSATSPPGGARSCGSCRTTSSRRG